MKPANRTARRTRAVNLSGGEIVDVRDFEQLAEQVESRVEHIGIAGFLRRIPHNWNLDELARFGREAGKAADALQLAYLTAVDRSLGVHRVFPVPLLKRVYTVLGSQFAWPAMVPVLDDGSKRRRNALRELDEARCDAPAPVKEALQLVTNYLECVTGGSNAKSESGKEKGASMPALRPV